jgi:hypothetical protein
MAKSRAWNIVRRAYGKYEVVAMMIGQWHEAECFAMDARVINGYDGEYFVRGMGERPEGYEVQSGVFYSE